MNILLIHQYFLEPDDAGGSRFNEMTKVWSEQGHKISVLSGMMHANGKEKRQEYEGKYFVNKKDGLVDVWRCHVSESYNSGFLGRMWAYFSFVFSSIWAGVFKLKGNYDVILVTSPPLFVGITAYVLSVLKKKPIVFEVRDLWPESAIDTGVITNKWIVKFAYWFESFIYRKAKLINVLTPAFKATLIEKKNIPSDKIIFIPNAADFAFSDKLIYTFNKADFRNKLGWQDKFVITYVGAHGVANHLIQVLDVAAIIKELSPDVFFVFIGSGMQKNDLMNSKEDRQLTNVLFLDPVPKQEIFKYIMASDFGMSVLKKVDTFKTIYSNKTFDYMACRKPLFLLIDGISRELVEEAQCGVYVEPENPQAFVEAILKYKDNKDAIENMGDNGYQFAKQNFDRSVLSNRYISLINRII